MGLKFQMWSGFHYFMIIFPFAFAILLYFITKNKSEQVKRNVALILSIIMIMILIVRNSYWYVQKGGLNPEVIPFQVCHFANFILLFTCLFKNKVFGTIAWCLNVPAGLVSVVFADGLQKYDSLLNISALAYVSGHMLIVAVGLYLLLIKMIKIDQSSLKRMYVIIGMMYSLSAIINNIFNQLFADTNTDANYFYTFKPEVGTPLETFYELGHVYKIFGMSFNFIYLLLLALVGGILFYGMYGIYKIQNKI